MIRDSSFSATAARGLNLYAQIRYIPRWNSVGEVVARSPVFDTSDVIIFDNNSKLTYASAYSTIGG